MAETTDTPTPESPDTEESSAWLSRIASARKRRDDKISEWQKNVEKRAGGSVSMESASRLNIDADRRIPVNQDWPLTKAKIAQLYSQTPEVRLTPRRGMEMFAQAVPAFARELNDIITDTSVGSTIEEVLADVVNASGIGGVLVTCEKRTEEKLVDKYDPMIVMMTGQPQEQVPVTTVADLQYLVSRISPANLLIPSDFKGSNYDHARWLGHDDTMTWAQAQVEFELDDTVKDKVLGTDTGRDSKNTLNADTQKYKDTDVVRYSELFYWCHFYDPQETSFKAIKRIVFVDGIDEPVVHEPYKAQARGPNGVMLGVTKFPIRILTLTYISDESLPPSDSSVSRYQVEELEQSRNDMVLQRRHSIPMRWGDTNRISSGTRSKLEEGNYQGIIWTNGPGDRAIGEVARASFPPEKFEFDKIIKNDLTELWQVGSNQAGAFASGERSAREAGIIEQNFQRRVGQEQDKVTKCFLGIAEVIAGHIAIYGTFTLPDELGQLKQQVANAFTYNIRADDTVRKSAQEQIEKLKQGISDTAQSGYLNIKAAVAKYWTLLGEDPNEFVVDPPPKAPEPVKVSVSKAEDLVNPVMLAELARTGQLPTPEDLAAVVKFLSAVEAANVNIQPPAPPEGPQGDIERPGIRNADYVEAPRINKRDEDGGA